MNNLTQTPEYKAIEERVKGELELNILRYITDEKNIVKFKDSSRQEFVYAGVKDYFNNFHFRFPDFRGFETTFAPAFKNKREEYERKFAKINKIKRDTKIAIKETGLNPSKIKDLTQRVQESTRQETIIPFLDYVLPVYVALRMKGYTQTDLYQGTQ